MILFLFSGAFSALFAVIAELATFSLLSPSGAGTDLWHINTVTTPFVVLLVSFFFVAVIEESAKFLVLARQLARTGDADRLFSGIPFGLGFALTEAIMAVLTHDGTSVPFSAMIGIFILHILTATAYGSVVGTASRLRTRTVFVIGILIHLGYDTVLALI